MFWNRFYSLCLEHNTKPNPVAKELNISSGLITKWKQGFLPNTEALLKLSKHFGVSIDFLLGLTNNIKLEKNTMFKLEMIFDRLAEIPIPLTLVSRETKLPVDKLERWENGEDTPTLSELKILCDYVSFPFDYAITPNNQKDISELYHAYNRLDTEDKAKIFSTIKDMLKGDKYNYTTSEKVVSFPVTDEAAALGGMKEQAKPVKEDFDK